MHMCKLGQHNFVDKLEKLYCLFQLGSFYTFLKGSNRLLSRYIWVLKTLRVMFVSVIASKWIILGSLWQSENQRLLCLPRTEECMWIFCFSFHSLTSWWKNYFPSWIWSPDEDKLTWRTNCWNAYVYNFFPRSNKTIGDSCKIPLTLAFYLKRFSFG